MVVRVGSEEVYLKVPKQLRRELDALLVSGDEIIAEGHDEAEHDGPPRRRIVEQVRLVRGEARRGLATIRICAKKNCWRRGGQELWRELEQKIESAGLGDRVRLKAVGCMDHCKRGPNVEAADRHFHHCTARRAGEILKHFAGRGR